MTAVSPEDMAAQVGTLMSIWDYEVWAPYLIQVDFVKERAAYVLGEAVLMLLPEATGLRYAVDHVETEAGDRVRHASLVEIDTAHGTLAEGDVIEAVNEGCLDALQALGSLGEEDSGYAYEMDLVELGKVLQRRTLENDGVPSEWAEAFTDRE